MENLPPKTVSRNPPRINMHFLQRGKSQVTLFHSHTHRTVALDSLALSPSHLVQTDTERGRKREKLSLLLDSPGSEVEDEWRSWIGS